MNPSETTIVSWKCCECAKEFPLAEFRQHLAEIHDIGERKGKREEMTVNLDGGFGSVNVYRWTIAGKKFYQTIQTFRTRAQKRRHDERRALEQSELTELLGEMKNPMAKQPDEIPGP